MSHCIIKNHFEVFQFFGRSLFQHRVQFIYDRAVITAFDIQAEDKTHDTCYFPKRSDEP